jgi:hypothetical protein
VRGTPTLFIDGLVHLGGYDEVTLLAALASARRDKGDRDPRTPTSP